MAQSLKGLLLVVFSLVPATASQAQAIYPIDRAEILKGSAFDFKVEIPATTVPTGLRVTINGKPAADVLGKAAEVLEHEESGANTAYWIRGASLSEPGPYIVEAEANGAKATVTWSVYDTPAEAKAKNVILFIGDGMSMAHRTAARILSKGLKQGRYGGELAIDDMDHMALVSTSGMDSVITDSANSMSAYTTGHKSCVSALGVYCAANDNNLRHPKVENITELLKRKTKKAVGIVTNTEIEDATPAAMVAHTRSRTSYDPIVAMLFNAKPDVVLGGGSTNFLPLPAAPTNVRTRADNQDYIAKFKDSGYAYAATNTELKTEAAKPETRRLLGLFNAGNIDGALDRKVLKKGTVSKYPDQPDLTDQTKAALDVLSRNEDGFMLMVESGRIDKYSHSLDWERAVYDTIMLDDAVKVAKDFAAGRNDTLIIVVADHGHPVSIIGTYDDEAPGQLLRDKLQVYDKAKFPNYPEADADGYPSTIDVSRRLAFVFAGYPDHCDLGRPHRAGEFVPAIIGADGKTYVANEDNCQATATRRPGNLPFTAEKGVHSGDDVVLTASGPGAEMFHGHIDNTYVFRVMATALGLGR